MVSETAAALGKSLWLACKCGDHDKALELLEQIENFPSDSVERDEALEYTDNKSNSILHVACASNGDGVEVQKKRVVGKLLDLGFILDDDNSDGKTCRDMAPKDFEKDLRELEERKKRGGRGASIIAEYRSFKNVAEAGFMAVAAVRSPPSLPRVFAFQHTASVFEPRSHAGVHPTLAAPCRSSSSQRSPSPRGARSCPRRGSSSSSRLMPPPSPRPTRSPPPKPPTPLFLLRHSGFIYCLPVAAPLRASAGGGLLRSRDILGARRGPTRLYISTHQTVPTPPRDRC